MLTVARRGTGGGSVTSSPAGIDCGRDCVRRDFPASTVVALTAQANATSTFTGWGGACSGMGIVPGDDGRVARPCGPTFRTSYRPDAWIKLCGLSTGCTIDPLPHPWRGNDVYNTTGARQKVAVRLDDGEGVRFWLTLQNDGALGDTFVVQGCKGNPRFVINSVLIGLYKRPDWRAEKITKRFKAGTAEFTFPPSSEGKKVHLTLNIVAPTTAEGVTYECPITLYAKSQPRREGHRPRGDDHLLRVGRSGRCPTSYDVAVHRSGRREGSMRRFAIVVMTCSMVVSLGVPAMADLPLEKVVGGKGEQYKPSANGTYVAWAGYERRRNTVYVMEESSGIQMRG